ncbi:MAG: hypothetical protein ACK56F_04300, partial [bacterium]
MRRIWKETDCGQESKPYLFLHRYRPVRRLSDLFYRQARRLRHLRQVRRLRHLRQARRLRHLR